MYQNYMKANEKSAENISQYLGGSSAYGLKCNVKSEIK